MTYVDKIVKKFGGARAMARAIGITEGSIRNWKRTGVIPGWHIETIIQKGYENEIGLRPEDFVTVDPKDVRLHG